MFVFTIREKDNTVPFVDQFYFSGACTFYRSYI